jgi:tRNA-dihydrouridine synthase 3
MSTCIYAFVNSMNSKPMTGQSALRVAARKLRHVHVAQESLKGHACARFSSIITPRCQSNTSSPGIAVADGPKDKVQAFREAIKGELILAPLTKGNNLPFRRLCADYNASVLYSEMAFARNLCKGEPRERALMRRAANEPTFGVQIATKTIDEGVRAGMEIATNGADFVSLNLGCPIYEATRRGLGSALLKKPKKLSRLIQGMVEGIPIPLEVKVRIGIDSINIESVVEALEDTGIAALTIHGRTAQQRYKKSADWDLIKRVTHQTSLPIIGNGDILTLHEARHRMDNYDVAAVMIGRGALTKPWVFREFKEGKEILPTSEDRVRMMRTLVAYQKEHFGDDDWGKRKSWYFLPWHLGWFSRYRPLPASHYASMSDERPLIATRWASVACEELGESVESLGSLERLLRCGSTMAHEAMSEILWEAESDDSAIERLTDLSKEHILEYEAHEREGDRSDGSDRSSDVEG